MYLILNDLINYCDSVHSEEDDVLRILKLMKKDEYQSIIFEFMMQTTL